MGFILTGESEREVERRMRECAASLGELAGACKDIQYFGGIGSCVNRLAICRPPICRQGGRAARFSRNEPGHKLQPDGRNGHGSGETMRYHSVTRPR